MLRKIFSPGIPMILTGLLVLVGCEKKPTEPTSGPAEDHLADGVPDDALDKIEQELLAVVRGFDQMRRDARFEDEQKQQKWETVTQKLETAVENAKEQLEFAKEAQGQETWEATLKRAQQAVQQLQDVYEETKQTYDQTSGTAEEEDQTLLTDGEPMTEPASSTQDDSGN
jgi:hypothetical protein